MTKIMNNNPRTLLSASCAVAAGMLLTGCEFMGPKPPTKLKLTPVSEQVLNEKSGVMFESLQNKKLSDDALASKIELYPASGRFFAKRAGEAGGGSARQASGKTETGAGTYSLNFDEADLGEVSKVILSDILGHNYVLSPKVAGKVTLQTTEPLTKDELLPALEMVLRMNNAALVKEGRIYHVEPATEAVYTAGVGAGEGYQNRVIPIRYVAAADVLEVIKPLLQEKTGISVDAGRNALLVSGSTAEINHITELVGIFDIDVLRGRSFGLFPLAHVAPEDVIKELEAVFNIKSGGETSNEFFRFLPIERLNAVLAITQQQSYLPDIQNWVLRLDRANSANGGGVNVYKVQHMDALELADILNAIFTGAAPQSKQAKVAPGQTAASITNKDSSSSKSTSKRSQRTLSTGKAGEGGGVSNVGENVRIIPDESNNSVVIVATPQEYEVIYKVITQLDVMPLQVLIDATIVSVTLSDNLKYGIQWYLGHVAGQSVATSGTGTALTDDKGGADLAGIAKAAVTGGFGYSFVSDSSDIRAILKAEANDNKLNVISSPSIMVLNNHEASIQVGDEIPLRTSQSSNFVNTSPGISGGGDGTTNTVNSGGFLTSGIQQRKTGVKLKVKPRVNANGFVIMDIEQTVETPKTTTVSQIDSPTIQTREITSNVAVQSGETIVLGGLIDENDTFNQGGIPFLHKLPLIGPLFGSTTKEKLKTELVVLITPRVLKTKLDASAIANEFKRKLTGIYDETAAPE